MSAPSLHAASALHAIPRESGDAPAYNFAHGHLTIVLSLLARPEADGTIPLPLTRADLYAGTVRPQRGGEKDAQKGRRLC